MIDFAILNLIYLIMDNDLLELQTVVKQVHIGLKQKNINYFKSQVDIYNAIAKFHVAL